MPAKNRLPRRESLKRNRDIQKLLKHGDRLSAEGFRCIWARSEWFGYVVLLTRKHGNAVQRNHTKRIFREAIRHQKDRLRQPIHLAVLPDYSGWLPEFKVINAEVSQVFDTINEAFSN